MQDGDSIKGKDEAKRETIEQAHLLRDTRKHVFLVSNSFHARIYNESKETKARIQCRATTEYDLRTGTLIQFYFTRLAPHTHTFTQNPKEMEVATSLWSSPSPATPSSSGVVRELVPRAGTCGRSTPRTGFPALSQRG